MKIKDKTISQYKTEYERTAYDRIIVLSSKGTKDKLKNIAQNKNTSVNALINAMIDDLIAHNENIAPTTNTNAD